MIPVQNSSLYKSSYLVDMCDARNPELYVSFRNAQIQAFFSVFTL